MRIFLALLGLLFVPLAQATTSGIFYIHQALTTMGTDQDAAIIAAARELGCQTVYSEDLNDGQTYDGVTVVNPFKAPTP